MTRFIVMRLVSSGNEFITEAEFFKKTPELVETYMEALPPYSKPEQYVVFKPLTEVDATKEEPKVVVFYANLDQLTALVVLANYGCPGIDNVISHFGSGCQQICQIPYNEGTQERPRAVIGMLDVSARPFIDADLLSFSMPYAMFREMEGNVEVVFLISPNGIK